MKLNSLILIALFVFSLQLLNGQYIPMVEEGKFWVYTNHQLPADFPSPISGHAITFQGDTVINSLDYKKVYYHSLKGDNPCSSSSWQSPCWSPDYPYQTKSKSLISFVREDTLEKKVYLSNGECDSEEHLIYDFSIPIGDTINSCIYDFVLTYQSSNSAFGIVDSIGVRNRYGKERSTVYTAGTQYFIGLIPNGQVQIYEGFGIETFGVFYRPQSVLENFCEGEMEPCHLILSDDLLESTNEIKVFPNPSKGEFQISMEIENIKNISIFSTIGKLKAEFFGTNIIDIHHLERGIYFLELVTKNDKRFIKKIILEN